MDEFLEARATSYWNCYYQHCIKDRREYPGVKFLYQIGEWSR